MKTLTIEVRQNKEGNWWCNTTYNGMDVLFEGRFMQEAKFGIMDLLKQRGFNDEIKFGEPLLYVHEPKAPKPEIDMRKVRIDHNPIG